VKQEPTESAREGAGRNLRSGRGGCQQSPHGRHWTAPMDLAELIDLDGSLREAAGPTSPASGTSWTTSTSPTSKPCWTGNSPPRPGSCSQL
jgi:hypothetical protein